MSPHRSDPELLVLHTLRLKGFVDADVVALSCRLPEDLVEQLLDRLAADGFVARREGRITGWSLTPEGRAAGERLLAAELDTAGCRHVVEDAYRRFLTLNGPFLECCTRWQAREQDGTVRENDHADAAYDAEIVASLDQLDDAVQAICADLAAVLERFSYYNGRFAAARLRVHAGDHDWFSKPMIDSYHSVWFELHENLLATLNIDRATEWAGVGQQDVDTSASSSIGRH
ncbi:MAG TPA: hypothetical protein VF183_08720 [Acidimicrobiales bacterium]